MFLLQHLFLVLLAGAGVALHVEQLPDGVLVHSDNTMRIMRGHWKMVITLHDQTFDLKALLHHELADLRLHLMALPSPFKNRTNIPNWISVLDDISSEIGTTSQRRKRSPFDFISTIGKHVFGFATDDDVQQLQLQLQANSHNIKDVFHYEQYLMSIINATHKDMVNNRKLIATLINSTQTIKRWSEALSEVYFTRYKELQFYHVVNEKIKQIRRQVGVLRDMTDQHSRRRADLERGRLTEELLPPHVIQEVANLDDLGSMVSQP